ncbi:hypothetical protein DFH29DRAFT_1000003 [Suillus ampliporus]|nr:hypothetical protein DFH29DRAFT_1000003 [Suillus ampliporus]
MPPRKKFLGLRLGRRRSNPHLPAERGVGEIQPSSIPPSINESPRGPPGPVRKFFSKMIKGRSAPGARQSPNPEPVAASSSMPDLLPSQTSQDPSPSTAPTRKSNPDQSSTSGILQAERPNLKVVNRIAEATRRLAAMKNVPAMIEHTALATNNLQPVTSDAINTFSVIVGLLKTFNSVANFIGDVRALWVQQTE